MDVVLYSTGCPKCKVLKKKLDAKDIKYTLNFKKIIIKIKLKLN